AWHLGRRSVKLPSFGRRSVGPRRLGGRGLGPRSAGIRRDVLGVRCRGARFQPFGALRPRTVAPGAIAIIAPWPVAGLRTRRFPRLRSPGKRTERRPQLLGHRGVLREGGPPFRRRMARGRILAIVSSAAPVTAVRATPAFLAARGATPRRPVAARVLASLPVPAMGAPALRASGRLRSPVSAGSGLPVLLSRPGIRL